MSRAVLAQMLPVQCCHRAMQRVFTLRWKRGIINTLYSQALTRQSTVVDRLARGYNLHVRINRFREHLDLHSAHSQVTTEWTLNSKWL